MKKTQGQIVVIIPLAVLFLAGSLVMWAYMRQMRTKIENNRIKTDVTQLATVLEGRIRNLLSRNSANPNCPNDVFTQFRDLTNPNPRPYSLSGNAPDEPVTSDGCILEQAESEKLDRFSINVLRAGEPDLKTLTARMEVSIDLRSRSKQGVVSAGATTSKRFLLRGVRLSRFNVILTGPAQNDSRMIRVDPNASVSFVGAAFASRLERNLPTLSQMLDLPSTAGKVVFERPMYVRAGAFASDPSTIGLRVEDLKRVFRKGIEFGVMKDAVPLPLPYEHDSTREPWRQKFDLSNSHFPLPDLPTRVYLSATSNIYANKNLGASNVIEVPNVLSVKKLDETCQALDPIPTYVFHRWDQDFTVDFQKNNPTNDPGVAQIFCGMVLANRLIINTQAGRTQALFGHFIANEIEIKGGGKVFFYDPADNMAVDSSILMPLGRNSFSFNLDMDSIASGHARNFYMPIFYDPNSVMNPTGSQRLRRFWPHLPDAPSVSYLDNLCTSIPPTRTCMMSTVPPPDYREIFGDPVNAESNLVFFLEESM